MGEMTESEVLTKVSRRVAYFIDDRCPTCHEPDKGELNALRTLGREVTTDDVVLKPAVVLPGNSRYMDLLNMYRTTLTGDEVPLPAIFYRGHWYRHVADIPRPASEQDGEW